MQIFWGKGLAPLPPHCCYAAELASVFHIVSFQRG